VTARRQGLWTGTVATLMALLCAVLATLWAASGNARAGTVTDIRIGQHGEMTRFVVEVKGKIDYRVFTLPDPYRVVLDLSELTFPDGQARVTQRGGVVERYRFGLFQPGISRVVLDLDRPAVIDKHFIIPGRGNQGTRLVIDMKPASRTVFMDRMERPAPLASAARPQQPARTPSVGGKKVVVIDPGHGGVDPGAISVTGVHEKDIMPGRTCSSRFMRTLSVIHRCGTRRSIPCLSARPTGKRNCWRPRKTSRT